MINFPVISFLDNKKQSQVLTLLPKVLKPALKCIPNVIQHNALLTLLNTIFKESITDGDFNFLNNKWLKISIDDLGLTWHISYSHNQLIMPPNNYNPTVDVSFTANGDDLLLIAARKEDPDTLFFQRRLKISGETELGLEVKNLIDSIDIEQLPKLFHSGLELCAGIIANTKS